MVKHVEPDYEKTVYVPYMSDHCVAIAGGMVAHGIPATVMARPDDKSLALGLDVCRGRECLPCFTTTGDMLRLVRQPGFQPEKSQILMVTSCGPCRFGQYIPLQKALLAANGAGAVEFISPSAQNNYQGFGKKPTHSPSILARIGERASPPNWPMAAGSNGLWRRCATMTWLGKLPWLAPAASLCWVRRPRRCCRRSPLNGSVHLLWMIVAGHWRGAKRSRFMRC